MAITRRQLGLNILGDSFELLPNALIIRSKPTEDEYDEAFRRLSLIETAQSWWWGDLATAREKHYGSLTELAEKYGKDYGALRDYQTIASRYELSTRVDSLSFKHHQIAAPLEDRLDWLKKAEENEWSARDLELAIKKHKTRALVLPEGVYDVIYADPPWEYSNVLPQWGAAELHYPTMPIQELCTYKDSSGTRIQDKFAENSVLFLWVTNPFLRDAFQVIDGWGFEYKTNLVWVKTELKHPGSGFWVRGRHELLCICSKGSFVPDQAGKEPIGSVFEAPVGEHSEKPDVVYNIIEKMYPEGKHLELFARKERNGWTSWGNEIEQRPRQIAGG